MMARGVLHHLREVFCCFHETILSFGDWIPKGITLHSEVKKLLICSIYGIFTSIYHENRPSMVHVGKYTIPFIIPESQRHHSQGHPIIQDREIPPEMPVYFRLRNYASVSKNGVGPEFMTTDMLRCLESYPRIIPFT